MKNYFHLATACLALTAICTLSNAGGVSMDGATADDAPASQGSQGFGSDTTPRYDDDSPFGTPYGDDVLYPETDGLSDGSSDPGDLNEDGRTNADDLIELLAAWGMCESRNCRADLNDDMHIDIDDLIMLFAAWS